MASRYKSITQGKEIVAVLIWLVDLQRTGGELPLIKMKAIWCITVVLGVVFIQGIDAQGMNQ